MHHDRFPINRDKRYWKTLKRDLNRYRLRRLAHSALAFQENYFIRPKWDAFNVASRTPNTLKRPTLSTCLITMNAANRIEPLLQYILRFSDEIVIAVDSKTTDNTLEICQRYTDKAFLFENPSLTCNAALEAIVKPCTSDWILRLDDDEFPEPDWLRYKDAILSQATCTHYKIPRLHLNAVHPLTWVNDSYLYPDYQMRLFQNRPELLSFPGAVGHSEIQCAGKRGKLHSIRLVHLNLAINPREKREEKLQKYIARQEDGWVHPVNEYALLFEDFNYHIKPYHSDDLNFLECLTHTVDTQRKAFETSRP